MPTIFLRSGRDEKCHQNLINVCSAKFLKNVCLASHRSAFHVHQCGHDGPERLHQRALGQNIFQVWTQKLWRNMLLDVIRIRHQNAMVENVQHRLQLFLRCLPTSEILGVVRESAASIALNLSNESDNLARLAEVLCLQRDALLQQIGRAS